MSFEQGREPLEGRSSPVPSNSGTDRGSRHENDLPQPPQPQTDPVQAPPKSEPLSPESREKLQQVLSSDIGLTTLLNRLKQSLSSARDFSGFLKERAVLEEKHAQSLKRLSRSTHDIVRRPESRSGTFASAFEESTKIHDRVADNGIQFAQSLNQIYNEIQELMTTTEKSRKHWKHTGMEAENRVAEAENAMNKARGRYNNLAEQYDRARTGEKSGGKFGIKGHKSAAQQEEDLHRKMEAADGEYAAKVQAAQAARQDLINTHRPQAVRALQAIIRECDGALSMQFAKYATLTERLLLGNGLCISPLKNQTAPTRSLREVVQSVDNEKDFNDHVLSFSAKAYQRNPEIRYEKHPSMGSKQQMSQPPSNYGASQQNTPDRINTAFNGPADHSRQFSQTDQTSGVVPSTGGFSATPQSPQGNQNYHQSPSYNSPLPQLPPISLSGEPEPRPGENNTPTRSPQNQQFGPGGRPSMDALGSNPSQGAYGQNGRPSMDVYGSSQAHSGHFDPARSQGSPVLPMISGGRGPSDAFGSPREASSQFDPTRSQGSATSPTIVGAREPSRDAFGLSQLPATTFDPSRPQGLSSPSDTTGSRGPSVGPTTALPSAFQPTYAPQTYQPHDQRAASGPGPMSQPQGDGRGPSGIQNGLTSPSVTAPSGAALLPSAQRRTDMQRPNLPPLRPVFGVSLDELFRRDGTAVPNIVYECVKAVDMFGLETEGIYRTSGSAPNIMQMKAQFDHGKSD